jgi:membrane-associated phospholipid phosphatase
MNATYATYAPDAPDGGGAPASDFLAAVASFDDRVDRLFEPLRGRPPVDAAAKVITGLGDHGWLWTGVAVWRGRRSGPARRTAVRSLGVAGVSSTLVNAGIKQVVGRDRPDTSDLRISNAGVPVRAPKTSSFPSGHTLAAFCSAAVLSRPGDRKGNALLYSAAGLIGVSRIHLRAHHASDVAGGIVIGTALGLVVRRFR